MRIRTLFSELHAKAFGLLGFEPVALDVKDLLAGVESGAVAAQENPLTNTYNFGIHDHHRYITLTGHLFGAAAVLCHAASYESWPAAVRGSVDAVVAAATAAQRGFAAAEDDKVLRKLDPARNQVIQLSPAERGQFVTAVAPLIEQQRRIFGTEMFRHLE